MRKNGWHWNIYLFIFFACVTYHIYEHCELVPDNNNNENDDKCVCVTIFYVWTKYIIIATTKNDDDRKKVCAQTSRCSIHHIIHCASILGMIRSIWHTAYHHISMSMYVCEREYSNCFFLVFYLLLFLFNFRKRTNDKRANQCALPVIMNDSKC